MPIYIMDLIKHWGRQEEGKGKREERSAVCKAHNFHCSRLFLLLNSWKLIRMVHNHISHMSSGCLHHCKRIFCLYAAYVCCIWIVLSIILIQQCFSSLFYPGSHSNKHFSVRLQCCCRLHHNPVVSSVQLLDKSRLSEAVTSNFVIYS